MLSAWSSLSKVVYKRTYSRNDFGTKEKWEDTVKRVVSGNIRGFSVSEEEKNKLFEFLLNRKAMPAGRGLWFSGTEAHEKLGGAALNNCWGTVADDWTNFIMAQDLLMLGGGVGMSVEYKHVSKLPKIKKDVKIVNKETKDADFIVPDSREGWNRLTEKIMESFFLSGKGFSYSTVCVRGAGEPIKGFGGKSSGPLPIHIFVDKICQVFKGREGKSIRPLDAADILCCIGELVVSGNVRRSAILILGDPWDKDYLKAKRWDLNVVPSQRAMANFSVNCSDIEDLHPLFWQTYEQGEAFGIVNLKNINKFARMGELKKDYAQIVNPCGEANLENGEPCNLQEIFLPRLSDEKEFIEAAKLMHRWGKRVTCEKYHNEKNDIVVKKNRRVGTGITGCLQSKLFNSNILDRVYEEIQKENISYSKELNIPESIRTTVIKPSGTLSLLGDCTSGIHAAFSRYYIRRVRFAANDDLIPLLKEAGHYMEPVQKLDGGLDFNTLVVDFYCAMENNVPCADEDFDTWKQLDVLKMAQKHWADQSVSVTVYYKKEEIYKIKQWLKENIDELKTISFLCHNEHGFKQAPIEAINKEKYEKNMSKLKDMNMDDINDGALENLECEGGMCPIK